MGGIHIQVGVVSLVAFDAVFFAVNPVRSSARSVADIQHVDRYDNRTADNQCRYVNVIPWNVPVVLVDTTVVGPFQVQHLSEYIGDEIEEIGVPSRLVHNAVDPNLVSVRARTDRTFAAIGTSFCVFAILDATLCRRRVAGHRR